MVSVFPRMIKKIAVRSYFHTNFSPRMQIASNELAIIAVAELEASNTRSANGKTTRIILLERHRTYKSG